MILILKVWKDLGNTNKNETFVILGIISGLLALFCWQIIATLSTVEGDEPKR